MAGQKRKRQVAVTGLGAVTPLGTSMPETWAGILAGACPAGRIKSFDAARFPTAIGYEVDARFALPPELLTPHEMRSLDRHGLFAIGAAAEAIRQAGLAPGHAAPERTAVAFGVGTGALDFDWHERIFLARRYEDDAIKDILRHFPNQLSSVLARLVQAKGEVSTIHTACASSGQAVGEAYEMIAYGDADVVVTGGADSMISPFFLAGFCLLGALSKRNDEPKTASRPFAEGRDGFVMGEGACALILEEHEHARRRGAPILGVIAGYGVTESAYRITDLHPEGHGPIEAMQLALADAGLAPAAIGYVNAHGTSTQLNDRVEALAIRRVFSEPGPAVSSTKSMTGHMIAAAGAVELAICLHALRDQILPPSINVAAADPECPVHLTPPQATRTALAYALSSSVGFGGSNTALIVGRGEA